MPNPSANSGARQRMAYIGLGSNQRSQSGDPAATLTAAITQVSKLGELQATSSFYDTEPVGYHHQPPFINAAAALRTSLEPAALLAELLKIERLFGRDRAATVIKGPRTLDLDILLMDDVVVDTPLLTIPHAALAQRRFVLVPLAEIAPDAVHPVSRKTIRDLLASLPDQGENRINSVKVNCTQAEP